MSNVKKDYQKEFVSYAEKRIGEDRVISRKLAKQLAGELGQQIPRWLFNDKQYRYGRGQYVLPVVHGVDRDNVTPEQPVASVSVHDPKETEGRKLIVGEASNGENVIVASTYRGEL